MGSVLGMHCCRTDLNPLFFFASHRRRQLLEIIWPALSPGYNASTQRPLSRSAPSQTQLDMMERQGVATFDSQVGRVDCTLLTWRQ
jgi:hypothetical protein